MIGESYAKGHVNYTEAGCNIMHFMILAPQLVRKAKDRLSNQSNSRV